MHINHKEALSLVLAARRWAPDWVGNRVIIYSDNKAAVGMLNKRVYKSPASIAIIAGGILVKYAIQFYY